MSKMPSSDPANHHGTHPATPRGVLLSGFAGATVDALTDHLPAAMAIQAVAAGGATAAVLQRAEIAVLCLGDGWDPGVAEVFLRSVDGADGATKRYDIVLAAGPRPEIFQDFIDRDQIYYLSPKPPPVEDIARIVASAWRQHQRAVAPQSGSQRQTDMARRVLDATRPIAEATLDELPSLAGQALAQLLNVEQAECLLYDADSETLWAPGSGLQEERRESAAAGVVSFVVRTAAPVRLDAVGDDPRYDPDADNNGGDPKRRFLAVPIVWRTTEDRVLGVLVALRAADGEPFSTDDATLAEALAERLAPIVERCLTQATLEGLDQHGLSAAGDSRDIFRREALEHYFSDLNEQGHLLRISPRWTQWTYPVLLSLFAAALIFSLIASVHEYADGAAIVRVEGRDDITAPLSGTVSSIDVRPGQAVAAGDVLIRLYGAQEEAELERLEREFELGLLNRLRNPADPNVEQALGALQARKRLAEARLEERSVRAPRSGVVSDVRVRLGQPLAPGEVVLSLRGEEQEPSIVAVFPGHYRPLIRLGMPLRLELQGYRYAYQQLRVDGVTDEAFGPVEARRLLGPGGDAVQLDGPVVLVYARLPSDTFESDGRSFAYHDGISGRAEIRVRSERLLTTLIPALDTVLPSPKP